MGRWSETRKNRRILLHLLAASTPAMTAILAAVYSTGALGERFIWILVLLACLLPADMWLTLVFLRRRLVDGAPAVSQWSQRLTAADCEACVEETLAELRLQHQKVTIDAPDRRAVEKAAFVYEVPSLRASVIVFTNPEYAINGVGLDFEGERRGAARLMERLDAKLAEREALRKAAGG